MAEWLIEDGIGETRAVLVAGGRIVECDVEREEDGLRAGTVGWARLTEVIHPRRRGLVRMEGDAPADAMLQPIPPKLAIGGRLLVEVERTAIAESARDKLAKVRPAAVGTKLAAGPHLARRIAATGLPVVKLSASTGDDRLEAAGWSELLDAARRGAWTFNGGELIIATTPAMTLIDIDGDLPPADLALAGATAAARAIRALGITGSIGIDFPTLADKAARQRVADAIDAALPLPFERTAVNGFGFLQIIRRRARPSLIERMQFDTVASEAIVLLRRAARARGAGTLTLTAAPAVIDHLAARPAWGERLARASGRAVALVPAPALPLWGGHAQ